MANPWREWPPKFWFFLLYTAVNTNVSGLSLLIGAKIVASVGYDEFENLASEDGYYYGAAWGALQCAMMGSLFWPCSMSLNVNERARVAEANRASRMCVNLTVLTLANLLSLVAVSYLLGKEKEIGKALICQFATPIAVLVSFCQISRLAYHQRPWQREEEAPRIPL